MKIPKRVIIAGAEYSVVADKRGEGGAISGTAHIITIGTKNPSEVPNILTHELLEACLMELGYRYHQYNDGNDGLMFAFDHAGLNRVALALSGAMKDVFGK